MKFKDNDETMTLAEHNSFDNDNENNHFTEDYEKAKTEPYWIKYFRCQLIEIEEKFSNYLKQYQKEWESQEKRTEFVICIFLYITLD